MHKQPPGHYSGIPALVPGGAMCTAGMAMLGSAFLQPTGYMPHVSKCSIVIDFCTKPCQAGLFSISAMSFRKFPFWDKFRTCSTQRLGTAFRLIGPGAPLFLSPPISCPVCHLRPTHLSICQLRQLWTPSVHPSDNSVQTPSIFSFFGQTFRIPTCVHPSPMDNIPSDWAQSPFIPITIHLRTFVPIPAHPPIHLPTPATPNSVCLAQILWVIHPYMLSYTLDTHCHPMAPSTQPPTIHIHRLKGHSVGLIAKPI